MRDVSIGCWRLFSNLDLSEARKTHFKSLHDCFTRELRPGLRPADPDPSMIVSPSDGIIGAHGTIRDGELYQIKGAPYSLLDLVGDPALVETHRNGRFITLRLTSSMYHRFHAPYDCHIGEVTLIHGDTWNVNPIALKRIERLFCKNERAVIRTRLTNGEVLTMVPVAAILVGKHPPARARYGAERADAWAASLPLRREREEGRRARMVRARLHHHPARARAFRIQRQCVGVDANSCRTAVVQELFSLISILSSGRYMSSIRIRQSGTCDGKSSRFWRLAALCYGVSSRR